MSVVRSRRRTGSSAAIVFALLAAAFPVAGLSAVVEEIARLKVTVMDRFDQPVAQEIVVTLVRDTTRTKSPILLLSHGRGATAADRESFGRARFVGPARFFVEQGYLVAMPTRIGYGVSGGPDLETGGRDCAHVDFSRGFAIAADETRQVLDAIAQRDDVDASRVVAVGVSYSGAATLALAARNPPGLVAAINFSGGSGGDNVRHPGRPCAPDRIGDAYQRFGRTTKIPELWMYAENDQFWGGEIPKDWYARYRKQGVEGVQSEFIGTAPVGDDGHLLFLRGGDLWHADVLRFLNGSAGPPAPQPVTE